MDNVCYVRNVESACCEVGTDKDVCRTIGKTVNGVMDAVNSFLPDPATKGSNGALGSAFWQKYVELYCYYCDTAPIDEGRLGRPVAKRDSVSNYSGFCQCRNAEVTITGAYSSEIDTIENYMNGGFYVN